MGAELGERQLALRRRGACRAVFLCAALVLVLAPAVTGCGKSGKGAVTDPEKASDAALLNGLLARELTLIDAYGAATAPLRGQMRAVAHEFCGHSQAHVDALERAIRGLGGETEAEAEAIESPPPGSRQEALDLLYEEENAALALAVEAAPHLQSPAPTTLAAALAANHAQHLVVLRQGLGAGLAAAVPAPLEIGSEPPPGVPSGEEG